MSVNKVILIGNVGKDPEVKYLSQTNVVAQFSLATSDPSYTASNGTVVPERTEWHNLVMWGGLAKTAETYVRKGQKLYVEGKLRNRSWDDQHGVRHYTTEIYVENFEILSPRTTQENSNQTTGQFPNNGGNSPF
ncbi:MAG: single-stranded DNA-binding protein [Paludibacteraceae bacterium]|nr:single-stranded DNA-binding protein [Paludibacteraceae bacterium]